MSVILLYIIHKGGELSSVLSARFYIQDERKLMSVILLYIIHKGGELSSVLSAIHSICRLGKVLHSR